MFSLNKMPARTKLSPKDKIACRRMAALLRSEREVLKTAINGCVTRYAYGPSLDAITQAANEFDRLSWL